jgi:branched-chain amino acid transport system permease protein
MSTPFLRSLSLWVIGFLVLLGLLLTFPLNGYVTNLLMQAFTYAIGVLGMTVVLGFAGQINIAQAAFFGLGAYGLALGTTVFHLSFSLAALAGMGIAALFGIVLGGATLKLSGHYLAMVTISFQEILTLVLTNWISLSRGPDGIPNIPRPAFPLLRFDQSSHYLALCLFFLVITAFLVTELKKARLGLAMQAVRDNPLAASVLGINVFGIKVTAFALSALLGGLGGVLFAGAFRYISPDQFSFDDSVVFLTMGLLGGIDAAGGAMIGTVLLILLPEWLRFLKEFYLAVYGLAVILIMIFMPRGIWGFLASRLPKPKAPALGPGVSLRLSGGEGGAVAKDTPLLAVKGLSKHFGGLRAVDVVDFAVRPGTIHALIGPNGSGKTTTLNLLSGLYRPTAGEIRLAGEDITRLPPHMRARRRMARTFQNIRLFHSLSAYDNVFIGAFPQGQASVAAFRERAMAALDFVGLAGRADEIVANLPYGHQRLVEIARALAADPCLLLLDEPGAGLNLTEKQNLIALMRKLRDLGLTILIIEHDMDLIARISDHITVLNFGRRIADGAPRDVLRHPDVIAAYLGEAPAHEAA